MDGNAPGGDTVRDAHEQQMLTFAFLAYIGWSDLPHSPRTDARTRRGLSDAFARLPRMRDARWEIAWGPANPIARYAALLTQNMMFVAKRTSEDGSPHYVVVIRGTNPLSPANWCVQDFLVWKQDPWLDGAVAPGAKISRAATIGLRALRTMTPEADLGQAQRPMRAFLADELASVPRARISITGHSLGGALAPLLALWLHDTRDAWDPHRRATIDVTSFAGPSPGNRAWARHYDEALGAQTRRLWNELDAVPHAWEPARLARLDLLYRPRPRAGRRWRAAFALARWAAQRGDYRHVLEGARALPESAVRAEIDCFGCQLIHQHASAYLAHYRCPGLIEAMMAHVDLLGPGARACGIELRELAASDRATVETVRDARRRAAGVTDVSSRVDALLTNLAPSLHGVGDSLAFVGLVDRAHLAANTVARRIAPLVRIPVAALAGALPSRWFAGVD